MSEKLEQIVARRPKIDFEVTPTAAQVESFHKDGFLSIERITLEEEMDWLGELYDLLFSEKLTAVPGGYFDLARPYDSEGADQVPQILGPEKLVPELIETAFYRNSQRVGAAILNVPLEKVDTWGHMILKPPQTPIELPWHQDEAYWHPGYDYNALGVWFPIGGASEQGGCLSFVPGSHRSEILEHAHISNDASIHGLYCKQVEEAEAVTVPLPPCGVTAHHCRTLHKSGGNLTDRPRRAAAVAEQTKPVKREVMYNRPWVADGAKAWAERGDDAYKATQREA